MEFVIYIATITTVFVALPLSLIYFLYKKYQSLKNMRSEFPQKYSQLGKNLSPVAVLGNDGSNTGPVEAFDSSDSLSSSGMTSSTDETFETNQYYDALAGNSVALDSAPGAVLNH